eukprot:1187684-Prorocentrum_minimum.AAC.1
MRPGMRVRRHGAPGPEAGEPAGVYGRVHQAHGLRVYQVRRRLEDLHSVRHARLHVPGGATPPFSSTPLTPPSLLN